jgi:hypothetical protein
LSYAYCRIAWYQAVKLSLRLPICTDMCAEAKTGQRTVNKQTRMHKAPITFAASNLLECGAVRARSTLQTRHTMDPTAKTAVAHAK